MNADIQGALGQINKVWKLFEHRGKAMTKLQVRKALEYGASKGYTSTSELTDEDVDKVIKEK